MLKAYGLKSSRGAGAVALFELLHFCLTYYTACNSGLFHAIMFVSRSFSSFIVCHHSSSCKAIHTRVVEVLPTGLAAYVGEESMRHIFVELVVVQKQRERQWFNTSSLAC
jgi:hypothetical protein